MKKILVAFVVAMIVSTFSWMMTRGNWAGRAPENLAVVKQLADGRRAVLCSIVVGPTFRNSGWQVSNYTVEFERRSANGGTEDVWDLIHAECGRGPGVLIGDCSDPACRFTVEVGLQGPLVARVRYSQELVNHGLGLRVNLISDWAKYNL
jgi:hypothetical protein